MGKSTPPWDEPAEPGWKWLAVECGRERCNNLFPIWAKVKDEKKIERRDAWCGLCAVDVVAQYIRENESLKARVKELEKEREKVTSWASVVKKGIEELPKANIATLRKDLVREEQDRKERGGNVIVSGLVPDEGKEEVAVREVAEELEVCLDGTKIEVVKLGKGVETKKILVKMSEEKKWELLKKAKELRNSTRFKNVFVQPDLTVAERKEQFELRVERREMMKKEPKKEWMIRMGKVVERKSMK